MGNAFIDGDYSWGVLGDIADVEGEGLFTVSVIDFEAFSEIRKADTSKAKNTSPNYSLCIGLFSVILCSQGIAYGEC